MKKIVIALSVLLTVNFAFAQDSLLAEKNTTKKECSKNSKKCSKKNKKCCEKGK